MMSLRIHLVVVLAACLCHISSAQQWYNDAAFMSYYNQESEVILSTDYSHVDVYLTKPLPESVKDLTKSKNYININKERTRLSLDMSQVAVDLSRNINIRTVAKHYALSEDKIAEIVPAVRVNGIKAILQKDFIIAFNSSISMRYLESVLDRFDSKIVGNRADGSLIIRVNKIKNGFDIMHELADLGMIEYAQPDMEVRIQHLDDPLFAKQFQLQNNGQILDGQPTSRGIDLNVVPAWETTKGYGVKVAVIDDGIEAHEDLPSIAGGFTPANQGDGTPESSGKHGMAVAGIISGQHNNLGVKGISPDSELYGVNIFATGTTISDYSQAFYWAVEQEIDIISNSWGFIYEDVEVESINPPKYIIRKGAMCSSNPFPALTSAINYAATKGRDGKGCIITFASGNWAQDGPLGQNSDECVTYPASLENVLAIGALNPMGQKSIYSNYGPKLDFVAPSNDLNGSGTRSYYGVRTIDREGNNGYSRSNYHSGFGGTSAATPAASGAIALILSAHPNLTREEMITLLKNTAHDVHNQGYDIETGHGLIDAATAISSGGNAQPIDPCEYLGGDSDNDGICDKNDCRPYDASFPATPGRSCDDGDESTTDDKITSDGCSCIGETPVCYTEGGDFDGDGYCLLDDCNDEDPNVPTSPGRSCDDSDATTENDIILSDGCTCLGTLIQDENTDTNTDDITDPNNNNNDNTDNTSDSSNGGDEDSGSTEEEDSSSGQDDTQSDEDASTEVECVVENLALFKSSRQSSTFFTFKANKGNDGDKRVNKYAQTNYSVNPFWEVDLGLLADLEKVKVNFRGTPRAEVTLFVSATPFTGTFSDIKEDTDVTNYQLKNVSESIELEAKGQYIRLQMSGYQSLALVELEAFGCEASTAVANDILLSEDLGSEIFQNQLEMSTYPNPASDDAFIEFKNGLGKSGELTVYNSIGIKIHHETMEQIPFMPIHIDLHNRENGLYIIEMVSDGERITKKLIVNR